MKCPHCTINFHEMWQAHEFVWVGNYTGYQYRICQCSACSGFVVEFSERAAFDDDDDWRLIFPIGANRGPVPVEVPDRIRVDYVEACNVLPLSAKASAALARRCLQNILRSNGYKAKDLATEIDRLLSETDASKAIPQSLRMTVDGIRNFGNFSAHPINDVTSLQVIEVEPHEAEWCLEILEEMFEHFYVRPAQAKARKAALDAKLSAAGKPASK
jgi:hypothetical protein